MMTDKDDPHQIEADLEQVRSGLASDLDQLSQRASIDYVAREALGMLKLNTSDATRTLDRAMRNNPTAFALVGLGLAWMLLGGKKDSPAQSHALHSDDPDPDWHRNVGGLREKAMDTLSRIETEARSAAGALQSKLSDQVEQVRDYAAERAQVVEDFTAELRTNISHGLEHLSDTAREQVVAAREQSYAAWLRAERVVKGGTREVVTLVEEHPVAVGAVALAIGAVAGMAFLKSGEADRSSSHARPTGNGYTPTPNRSLYDNTSPRSGVVSTGGAGMADTRAMSGGNPAGAVPPL